MKREDLTKLGLTEENVTAVLNLYHTEVDPIREDLTKTQDDLKVASDAKTAQENTIKALQTDLNGLKAEDVGGLKQKITDLGAEIEKQKTTHAAELADRDFKTLLDKAIVDANGKNATAIAALLDADALKASKNQKGDIEAQLKALAEKEDSAMLFGTDTVNRVDGIGKIKDNPPTSLSGVEKAFLERNPGMKLD